MRLGKFLAHAGVASRRAAEGLIADGRVTVGGEVVTNPATDVDERSGVAVDGRTVAPEQREVHALNKPAGVVSTARDTHGRPTVVELVRSRGRLYPVGRLDADSTGLILLTNDGELADLLTHPRYGVEKVYRAKVQPGRVPRGAIDALRRGVELEDGVTAPARVRQVGSGSARDHAARGPQAPGQAHVRGGRPPGRRARARGVRAARPARARAGPQPPPQGRRGRAPAQGRRQAAVRLLTQSRAVQLRALRGAITVEANEADTILSATEELVREVVGRNDLSHDDIVSCIFTCTGDLDAEFPAVAARNLGLSDVPLLCAREMQVPGSLPRVIRLLMHCYCDPATEPSHVYLREAVTLRKDLHAAQ